MLYLIFFNYTAPLEALNHVLPAHHAHLGTRYVSGHFLMSRPFLSCEGSGTLAHVESREKIDTIVACDPFMIENLAQAHVIAQGLNRRSVDVSRTWLLDAVVVILTQNRRGVVTVVSTCSDVNRHN